MKEVKKFFYKDSLNKGYAHVNTPRKNSQFIKNKYKYTLPPADIISQYEDMFPGFTQKFVSIIEKEQEHRQKMELIHSKKLSFVFNIGRITSFLFFIILTNSCLFLCFKNMFSTALTVFGTAIFIYSALLCFYLVKFASKSQKYSK